MYYAQDRCNIPREKWREFLQVVGTELFRAKDPNVWVNLLIKEVHDLGPNTNIIISDARFNNEFEALKQDGFVLVKIVRYDAERMAEEKVSEEVARHASEIDMLFYEGFDHVIINCGTLEDLYRSVDYLIEDQFEEDEAPNPSDEYDPVAPEGAEDLWSFFRGMSDPEVSDFGHPI